MGRKSEINKLAGYLNFIIGAIIGAAFLYFFSFILVLIGYFIYAIAYKIYRKIFPLPEWSNWVLYDTAHPKITHVNGVRYFQTIYLYKRVNNYTGETEIKREIDPIKNRLGEATILKDKFFLKNYSHS